MPSELFTNFAQTISNGLRRKSIVDCYNWATKCRVLGKPFPGPYSDKYFPWVREMHNCNDEKWVAMKAAQIGITEVVLNRTLFTIDIKRVDCLYLLPSQTPDASNFSASRFDPALEMSPYLKSLFSDVMNVGHKRAGSTNLFIRGTHSRSQLKTVPVGLIVFDELDEMTQKNLSLAEERTGGQTSYQIIKLSTPTVPGTGIVNEFNESTQEYFNFKCPCCSRFTELIYPECLVITGDSLHDPKLKDSHLICKECKNKLHHGNKCDWLKGGKFVPTKTSNTYRGFHINGLYSSAALRAPAKIAEKVFKAQSDASEEQELYNSVLGKVHVVKGAQVTDEDIDLCRKDYKTATQPSYAGLIITMGVDQGVYDHYYEVDAWLPITNANPSIDINTQYLPKVIDFGIIHEFLEIDELMRKWQVMGGVMDAFPAKRSALEVAARFPGSFSLCYYPEGVKGKNINISDGEPVISVDRTSWLDLSLGRFKSKLILLPNDISDSYKKHIKAPVRVPGRDKHGNPTARYVTGDDLPDHFAHARNYAEIALELAIGKGGKNKNMQSPR